MRFVCHLFRFSRVRHPVWPLEELLHQWGEWPERCLHHRPWARARVSTFPCLKNAPSACSHSAPSTCIASSNGAACFSSLILERLALWVLFVIRVRSDGCTDQQTSQRSRAWVFLFTYCTSLHDKHPWPLFLVILYITRYHPLPLSGRACKDS